MTLPATNATLPRFLASGSVPRYRLLEQTPRPVQAPAAPAEPVSKSAQLGKAVLSTASAGLGIAGVAFPPAVSIAGVTGLVQTLDNQIGNPIATAVGATIQAVGDVGGLVVDGVGAVAKGIGDGATAVGNFFVDLFGGK